MVRFENDEDDEDIHILFQNFTILNGIYLSEKSEKKNRRKKVEIKAEELYGVENDLQTVEKKGRRRIQLHILSNLA